MHVACFDPQNFPLIKDNELPPNALQNTSEFLLLLNEDATIEDLQSELTHLAMHWDSLKKSPLNKYTVKVSALDDASEMEEEEDREIHLVSKKCAACKNCALCCYFLTQLNLLT